MRQADVEKGRMYRCKVSGRMVTVKILTVCIHGYVAKNLATGRTIHLRSARRLRQEVW